jgi:hypothetical protein
MSGAADAAVALREAALARYDELRHMVSYTSAAVLALRGAGDLMDVLREADKFSLALEALAELAKAMHTAADRALAAAMDGTGATTFHTKSHAVSTRRNPAVVEIPDEKAVPDAYMTAPAPRPDRAAIRAAVLADPSINWASIRENGIGLARRNLT